MQTKTMTVRNFLKIETSEKCGDPRNISPRNDLALSTLGPYISAIEHKLVAAPFLVKGLSLPQRIEKMSNLRGYRFYYETDYSRFDASISAEMLASFEHMWLTLCFDPVDHEQFAGALAASLVTSGRSDVGVTYRLLGTRCSGDAHTSVANGVMNHMLTFLMTCHLSDCVSYHEGDDGIIATNEGIDSQFETLPDLGFLIKVDKYNHLNDTSFCGMFLVDDPIRGLQMYSDPLRCMAKLHTACADGLSQDLLVAKAMSIFNLNPSTPIITAWCQHILRVVPSRLLRPTKRARLLSTVNRVTRGGRKQEYIDLDIRAVDITPDVRASFAARTGIGVAEQLAYERYLLCLPYVPESYELIKREVVFEDSDSTLFNFLPCLYV